MESSDWNRRWEARLEDGPIASPNRFLVAEADGLGPGRALDLACGAGRNAVWLAERGWVVTAVDFSDVALEAARALARSRRVEVTWVQGDVRSWSAPASFDLVSVLYLQLPEPERAEALARAAGAVAPGGTLVVVAHHLDNLGSGWGGPSSARVLCTERDVVADLPGLEIERAERVLRPVETEGGERTAVDLVVRARRPAGGHARG